eukprot:847453-Amphidinium_carterae.1
MWSRCGRNCGPSVGWAAKRSKMMTELARKKGEDSDDISARVAAFGAALLAMKTASDHIDPIWDTVKLCLSNKKQRSGWHCILRAAGLMSGMQSA